MSKPIAWGMAAAAVAFALSAHPAWTQTVLSDQKVPLPKEETGAGDRFVLRAPGEPAHPAAGTWGYDAKTGVFKHPAQTPFMPGLVSSPGLLDYLDQNQYALNAKAEAFYPHVVVPNHTAGDLRFRRPPLHVSLLSERL